MKIDVLSLFPGIASAALCESMMKRAQEKGFFTFKSHDLRDWTHDKYRRADDAPYGGGQGMVMKCEPIFEAVESLRTPETRVVFMGPCGRRFDQRIAQEYSTFGKGGGHLFILCGHYEGVDQRVLDHLVDDEISIGDYVLTNGVIAAVVFVDAIVRLIPGVLGDDASATDDSFATGLLEFPHYTRPPEYRGWKIPDILLSGNHAAIERWRREQALERTRQRRPDLLPPKKVRRLLTLDPLRHLCDSFPMPATLEQVTKEAMDLPARQKLALAEFLLESAEAAADPDAEAAWDSEIRDRIRAIDEGRVTGVSYEDVMRSAEARLVP